MFGCHADDSNTLSEMNAKHSCSWLEQINYEIWMNNQEKGVLVTQVFIQWPATLP